MCGYDLRGDGRRRVSGAKWQSCLCGGDGRMGGAAQCVIVRRCGKLLELCARSSAGSERLATNQKVGSSNLSGRTIFPTKWHLVEVSG